MAQAKYTLDDIEALRSLVENKYLYGAYRPKSSGGCGYSRGYMESDRVVAVEEGVRTLMVAGIRPEDVK